MSRDEALVAVLNAARVVRATVGPGAALPADLWPAFRQLAAAVDAVDAVGETDAELVMPPARVVAVYRREDRDRPGLCQADPECWRTADVGSTCYHHSPMAQKPHPWQTAQLRAGVFAPPEEA